MSAIVGSAPYIYVCTRFRVRRMKLIPQEEYLRMLQMSLPEIIRLIQETEYKREIDELSHSFHGIDLIEVALSWNLAKTYQKVLAIMPEGLREMTESYLRRWDIQNVLSILRGKAQGLPPGKIKEVLIPAGELNRDYLDKIITCAEPEKVLESLKRWRLFPVLARELPRAAESGSFSSLENELYKQFYHDILEETGAGIKGGKEFLEFLRLEIDIRNLQTLFRLRVNGAKGEVVTFFIPGGTFTVEELVRLHEVSSPDAFFDSLTAQLKSRELVSLLGRFRQKNGLAPGTLHEIESALTLMQYSRLEMMARFHPFSIWPILAYIERKKQEITNLRAITRGKQAGLPMEQIRNYLVM
ncbi:MAG: V-type ATP synthase subunit C [Methanomicrobiales archaeon]|nr:V-type ATP synthase subunit C [Methanomicrobiales archaeon]